jgi:hypothetical protein
MKRRLFISEKLLVSLLFGFLFGLHFFEAAAFCYSFVVGAPLCYVV